MEDGPLAVLEKIRSVRLVKIVPRVRNLSTRLKSSSLERTNTWQVWNYNCAFRYLVQGPRAVG
jgi:hypothetical protein